MKPKLFVISLRCGRLANRLVLFANFIALAEEQGHRLSNVTFHSYASWFEATRKDIYCRYPPAARRSLWDRVPGAAPVIRGTRLFYRIARAISVANERFPMAGRRAVTLRGNRKPGLSLLESDEFQAQIADARVVFIHGWRFRAPVWLQRHAGAIRDYFRPIPQFEDASREAVDRLRRQSDVVVGVHIRLGDNWKWKGGKYYFPVSDYVRWMGEIEKQLPERRVSFLICSDEPRNPEEFPGRIVGMGPGSAVGDLYALARCDYLFGPLSTFTQWASFYGKTPMLHLESRDAPIDLSQFQVSDLLRIP